MTRFLIVFAFLAVTRARLHTPKTAPHLTPRDVSQVQTAASSQQRPMFSKETMPKVSPTIQCVICLSMQYFIIYTVLAVIRTLSSFQLGGSGRFGGWLQIMHKAATTVTYAPMLCVLFLGARMRAIQLTQGETEKFELPQPWVQWAMYSCTAAVFFLVIIVLIIPVLTGEMDVPCDKRGFPDMKQLKVKGHAASLLSAVRYVVQIALYGGFTTVIVGVFRMEGPQEIWGGSVPPVSPAVLSTIILTTIFFAVHLVVAVVKTIEELSGGKLPQMLAAYADSEYEILEIAENTVAFAPMLSILFIGARMRALQMDPKHGNPQVWAQMCFYGCAGSVAVQALMVLIMPLCLDCKVEQGDIDGEVVFQVANTTASNVVTAVRYVALVVLYCGFTAVIVSVFLLTHPTDIAKTPPISPAMQCVINLTVQYFTIYLVLMICLTVKRLMKDGEKEGHPSFVQKITDIFEAAKDTVMFAPMLSMLYIGARMRALQLTKATDGTIPPTAGPQTWVQEAMFVSAWSVLLQLIMVIIVGCCVGEGRPEMEDGHVKVPANTNVCVAYVIEAIRYIALLAMYGGVVTIIVGIFLMKPEVLPPYNHETVLPAGYEVPPPPAPPTKAELAF